MNNFTPYYFLILFIYLLLIMSSKMDSSVVYWLKILLGVGTIIGAGIALILYLISQKEAKKSEHNAALEGTLTPKKNTLPSKTVNVKMGGLTTFVTTSIIESGYEYRPMQFGFGSPLEFIVRVKNGKVYIDALFKSLDDKRVCVLRDNQWKINPDNYFKKEFNDNKLDVSDAEGRTRLQIDFTDQFNIIISGVFYDGTDVHVMSENMLTSKRLYRKGMKQPDQYYTIYQVAEISKQIPSIF